MKCKVVYNGCYGGFSLSREAVLLGRELSGNSSWGGPCIIGDKYKTGEMVDADHGHIEGISRHDDVLVRVVEAIGNSASGFCSDLKIAESGVTRYRIDEYDGYETVVFDGDDSWIDARG